MTVFAVVPVKDLGETKSRLSSSLDPDERAVLTLWMLEHVLATLREARGVERIGVVSPSPRVLFLAEDAGASTLPQESRGLNNALEEGRDWAISGGASSLLVLPADLPYLSASDVWTLLKLHRDDERGVVISPDNAREGTNALLMCPPEALPFLFGPCSYEAHLRTARERGLQISTYEDSGIAFDLDTKEDLERLIRSRNLSSP
ncbi:MAG: 2-phospho-L-lactate guanylyltransferase [Actinobacteria bacterium]|nr:2-phospho-L-lactate guanylyltransferase [Actinomycetota bacterium]